MRADLAADTAAQIAEHFRLYNEEFGRITRRAARNFLTEDWQAAQIDSVERIELYEVRVARCVATLGGRLQERRTDVSLWVEIKRAYETLVARRPDSDFYHTFFNSVTRDLFGTVGVNPEVEFCATTAGRASGSVPIRVYRVGGSLPAAVRGDSHRPAFQRGAGRPRVGGASHQRGNRPLFRDRPSQRRP